MPQEPDYTSEIYNYLGTLDKTYQKEVSLDKFKESMKDKKYASDIHSWISSKDETFTKDVPFDDFYGSINPKTPAVPSFSTDMKNTNTNPVMKNSPLQASVDKLAKEPVASKVPQENPFLKKANNLVWDKTPLGQEQKKTEIVGMLPQTPAKPTMAVKSEEDKIIESGINGLPALSKIMLKNNPIYNRDFNEWLKVNPKEAQRLNAYANNKDVQSEYQKSQVFDKFQKDILASRILKLTELENMGAGEILKQKNDLYTNINKVSDELKKKQTELNFYQNTFLKQSGNIDLVDRIKELSSVLNKYDKEKIIKTLTGIDAELNAIVNEIKSITSEDNTIAQEYAAQYTQLYSRAKSLEQERTNIENDPEFLKYNAAINEYNNVQKEINNNIGNLNNDPEYKKTVEGYNSLFNKYKQIAGSIEGLKKDDPLVNEYLSLSKQVADIDKTYKSINSGFFIKAERDRLQKESNEKGEFSGKIVGVVQSIPQAVFSLAAGGIDLINSVNEGVKGNNTSLTYTTLDKAADFYNTLEKVTGFISPEAKSIKENGDINWADIPYEAFLQVGNLAVMAVTGGSSTSMMVGSAYLMSRKGRTDEADEAGLTGVSKEIYVNGLSLLEGFSELIMPDAQLFTRTIRQKLLKDAVLAQTKGIVWFRKQAMVTVLENMLKEDAEELIVKLGELGAQYANNLEQGKNVFDIKKSNTANEYLRTILIAAPLAGISTGLSKIGVPKKELDIARFIAAKNITQTRQILSDLVASGKITQEKADENYKQIIRYAAVQNVMPKDISPEKAIQLVPLIEENKELELQIKTGGISDMFISSIKEKIKENNDKAQAILEMPNTRTEIAPSTELKASEEIEAGTPAPNTKFYQGVDFKAQTGLPNGDYTEEQVKAARENKLKEAGVPPLEIEKINAEQEIVPATETPAAPISGVSGEVQASGDVEEKINSLPKEKQEELKLSLYKEEISQLIKSGKIEYKDDVTGKPCLRYGGRGNSFNRGSEWEIVKDLKGYKPHEQGGVDLKIGKDGVNVFSGKSSFYAKDGLLFSDGDPIEKRIAPTFSEKEASKIKQDEAFLSDFIKSPKYREMLLKQFNGDEKATDENIGRRLAQLELTKYDNTAMNKKTGEVGKPGTYVRTKQPFGDVGVAETIDPKNNEGNLQGDVYLPSGAFTSSLDYEAQSLDPVNYGGYPLSANVPLHEMTHRSLGVNDENITPYAKDKVKNIMAGTYPFAENMGNKTGVNPDSDPTGIGAKNEMKDDYWQRPTEVLARTNAFRKLLYDKGVYDPKTESIDKEKYNAFKEKLNKRHDELSEKPYKKLSEEEKKELREIYDINQGFGYMNDSIFEKQKEDDDKKRLWMLNNLVKIKREDEDNV
jgi:hypothetical protein